MRIAAIYNVWIDSIELLATSINSISDSVDRIIIVYQTISNFGEPGDPLPSILEAIKKLPCEKVILHRFTPRDWAGAKNETEKRNIGLSLAKNSNCTHFLHMDADEVYENFTSAKLAYENCGKSGSVCKIFTYFKLPTLRFDTEDGYFVPFIHELRSDSAAGFENYPFYVDPTRAINCHDVSILDVHMHHFSWCRVDIERKMRNSTARNNLKKGTMLQSYRDPGCQAGFYVSDYDKKLISVPDQFNLLSIFL